MDEKRRRTRRFGLYAVLTVIGLGGVFAALPRARANAPVCRYDTSVAGTVLDNDTGLTWEQSPDDATYDWASAKTHCEGLTLDGKVWRLPSIQELHTIVDLGKNNPAIDTTAFPSAPTTEAWSSSPDAKDAAKAWYIAFGDGRGDRSAKTTLYRARCVH